MNQAGGSGIDTGTAGVLALLADTARAGRGYGYGEGGYGGGPFASPSANAVRINRNNDRIEDEARHNDTNRICDRVGDGFNRLAEGQIAAEFRTGDRIRDVEREMNANARESAKCCCEIKESVLLGNATTQRQIAESEGRLAKQACEDKAQIIAEIKAVESRNVERALNAANAELTALKTQIACGCCPPGPHHGGHGH